MLLILLTLATLAALGIFFWGRNRGRLEERQSQIRKEKISKMIKHANEIVAAYGGILEQTSQAGLGITLHSESQLPYPKIEIRKSIEFLLLGPLDQTQRNYLATANIFLNDFIPDEEYHAIHEQQVGLSNAVEFYATGEKDANKLASLIVDSTTPASRLLLRQIEDRITQENKAALERHQTLMVAAAKLAASGS